MLLTLLSRLVLFILFTSQTSLGKQIYFAPHTPLETQKANSAEILQDAVQWDKYSLIVHGERIVLWSGEFHTWRLPSTDLWLDVLQKIKAGGFNAISMYVHWGTVEANPGELDFADWRQIKLLFDLAAQTGLYVVARPGPYINAETSYGGIPGWVTQLDCALRTNETAYFKSWQKYIKSVASQIEPYQATYGGPIIAVQLENEHYDSPGTRDYMIELRKAYREANITVPLTFNDGGMRAIFSEGRGAPDIYGFDSYPQLFDCDNPDVWKPLPETYNEFHNKTNPDQPLYIPEYQGGAFDRWGGPGYEACARLTGSEFERVFMTGGVLAANAKMVNLYMLYGGTTWGNLAFPGVYTSYDYGSAIKEDRSLRQEKYGELKLIGMFLQSAPDFAKTDLVATSTDITTNNRLLVTVLRNPDTKANFYTIRHRDAASSVRANFRLKIETTLGSLTIPEKETLRLNGRDAKVVVTDFPLPNHKLLYCTASIFFASKIGERDVLAIHADAGDYFELVIDSTHLKTQESSIKMEEYGKKASRISGHMLSGVHAVEGPHFLLLIADTQSATASWTPELPKNEKVLVEGPYLVRNATTSGNTLSLFGDIDRNTTVTVLCSSKVKRIKWNAQSVNHQIDNVGRLSVELNYTPPTISLPNLESLEWFHQPSLPEIHAEYNAASMTLAQNSLFAGEYGFLGGTIVYRGTFNTTRRLQQAITLHLAGGTGFGASLYLNGLQIGFVSSAKETAILSAHVPPDLLWYENVLVLLLDTQGGEEGYWPPEEKRIQNPRGILTCTFQGPDTPIEWRIQGNKGGNTEFPDKMRGVYNEGGLFGERENYHMPELGATHWEKRTPFQGVQSPGVSFFRTSFDLDLPEGYDVPLSFQFDSSTTALYRVQLYVNGWQFGKRIPHIGPQTDFPVPKGILNHNGKNTIALSFWTYGMREEDWHVGGLQLKAGKIVQTNAV